jgi:Holliday junction DNA helicase RuvA
MDWIYSRIAELGKLAYKTLEKIDGVSLLTPKANMAGLISFNVAGIEPNDLVTAIKQNDIARLTGIPGIGKKTAERIGLELKDKLAAFIPADTSASAPGVPGESLRTDVLSALINLGYHRPLAERAADTALKSTPAGSFEHTLKLALRELAR